MPLQIAQRQVFLDFLQNKCSSNCRKIHWRTRTIALDFFFLEVAGLEPATLLKRLSGQLFSCEFYKIFKNTFFDNIPVLFCAIFHGMKKVMIEF